MHQEDIALYSAMQTIKLRQLLTMPLRKFRHESEFAAFVRGEMKRLYKNQSLSRRTLKYFDDVLCPTRSGFIPRWQNRFQRYLEIQAIVSACKDKTTEQRLQLFFTAMKNQDFAVQFGHSDQLEFDEVESAKVLNQGFVGMAQSEVEKLQRNGLREDTYLTYYLGADDENAELRLTRSLQSLGFNFYFDAASNNGKLERGIFAYIVVVSFAEQLLPARHQPPGDKKVVIQSMLATQTKVA
ncbi:hypothetical protein AGRI_08690 [Alishewanella agri BL06]|uniref:Uncharacterized protein n=1 Tax=Alishewanella agri BL06 TaxID=1195246 RepID=I9DS10_9ALTE|nr:hypothetical protein [Alishewanella agri]EIW88850.1 hypothetical protein AGRI_08690 [Alishewanella agri BL06]